MSWYEDPQSVSLQDAAVVLRDPDCRRMFPHQFLELQQIVEGELSKVEDQAKLDDPLAFARLSFEQVIKCNAWWCGITNIINFSANRIGKTAAMIFNALLYILPLPPDEDFRPFNRYQDHKGRWVQLLRRPSIQKIIEIQKVLKDPKFQNQFGVPNPELPFDHPENIKIWKYLLHNKLATPNPPHVPSVLAPPTQSNPNILWHGAPDKDAHLEVTLPLWAEWTPKRFIKQTSLYEGTIDLEFPRINQPHLPPVRWKIITKSYDSKDTKWAGAAVDGIILSEGPTQPIFNEVKQRFKTTGFGGWDYTPYEPRNQGHRSNLAHRVAKGEEQCPLRAHIFTNESALDTPDFILPQDKKDDLFRMWHNKPEGRARLYGEFFTSIPLALKSLDQKIHCLHITFADLRKLRPNLLLYRGIDPGWGHVTACVWVALSPQNEWFIYRGYSESQRVIEERVCDIISLSGNERVVAPKRFPNRTNRFEDIPVYVEIQKSEQFKASYIDWHTFKTDELTGTPFAMNYVRAGLKVTESIHLGPRERAQIFDQKAFPNINLPHPLDKKLPGARVYFVMGTPDEPQPGVALIWDKLTNLFYKVLEGGPRRGQTTDQLQEIDDDEFDASSYVVSSPIRYIVSPNDFRQENLLANKKEMMGTQLAN